ncbi:MAG TPA: TIGR02680 family protein, partial [Agromyces sp.]|nr:TIGR02680 family protein [Agromyces sp.]
PMSLPEPAPGRFKPLRCGLVELFLYEAQEFPFRDGRLLLRGDNGSGKSKVLALTLPLLLDANLTPARMEPDADPKKQMAWNLLMGDEHDERTGYSWVEFGRVDDDGVARFVTLGLGVKAVQHRGVVKQWWFLTDQRIGDDLHLVDRLRTVRTRERLIEAIGDHGSVFDTAERYRRAVDETLFGLHNRYDSLIDLLVHLRQPQLSKRPNEEQLNRALTEALPPVRDALIDVVAQSYQSLEEEERDLLRLRSGADAVRSFTTEYARYARDATARASAAPRQAQSNYEEQRRRLRAGEEALVEAASRHEDADREVAAGEEAVSRLDAERDVLRERRGAEQLIELDTARNLADQSRAALQAADEAEIASRRVHDEAEATLLAAGNDLAGAEQAVRESSAALGAVCTTAGIRLDAAGSTALGSAPEARGGDDVDADALARAVTAEAGRRQRHLDDLSARIADRDHAASTRNEAQRGADRAAAALAAEDERMQSAQAHAEMTGDSWLESVRESLTGAEELRGDGLEEALAAAAEWVGAPVGDSAIAGWISRVQAERNAALAAEQAAAEAVIKRVDGEIAELDRELAGLEGGEVRRPDTPRTRTADRTSREGATFWECVDILPGISDEAAAGIEAALEASGLLDAWSIPMEARNRSTATHSCAPHRLPDRRSPTCSHRRQWAGSMHRRSV